MSFKNFAFLPIVFLCSTSVLADEISYSNAAGAANRPANHTYSWNKTGDDTYRMDLPALQNETHIHVQTTPTEGHPVKFKLFYTESDMPVNFSVIPRNGPPQRSKQIFNAREITKFESKIQQRAIYIQLETTELPQLFTVSSSNGEEAPQQFMPLLPELDAGRDELQPVQLGHKSTALSDVPMFSGNKPFNLDLNRWFMMGELTDRDIDFGQNDDNQMKLTFSDSPKFQAVALSITPEADHENLLLSFGAQASNANAAIMLVKEEEREAQIIPLERRGIEFNTIHLSAFQGEVDNFTLKASVKAGVTYKLVFTKDESPHTGELLLEDLVVRTN